MKETKQCIKCNKEYPISHFQAMWKDVVKKRRVCSTCKNLEVALKGWNRSHKPLKPTKHARGPKEFLRGIWKSMQRRVSGKDVNKEYTGLYICSHADFIALFKDDPKFLWLLEQYDQQRAETQMECRSWAPSIDRVLSSEGYTLDNIRFISQSYNSHIGTKNRHKKPPMLEAEYEMYRFNRVIPNFHED